MRLCTILLIAFLVIFSFYLKGEFATTSSLAPARNRQIIAALEALPVLNLLFSREMQTWLLGLYLIQLVGAMSGTQVCKADVI